MKRTRPSVAIIGGGIGGLALALALRGAWVGGLWFGIAPVDEKRTYWYASENAPPGLSVPPGGRKARLRRLFADWHAPIPELIEGTDEAEILLNEIADHAPLRSWHRGNVAVLGDAAHLMTPNLGQGAATALEDAWTLARCVAELPGRRRSRATSACAGGARPGSPGSPGRSGG